MTSLNQFTNLQHVFKVSELLSYDMIYIYHHLQEGTDVTLVKDEIHLEGKFSYLVYFKGFKLGSVLVSALFTAMYGEQEVFIGQVASVTKEKYMPIKELDIVVHQLELKLVS